MMTNLKAEPLCDSFTGLYPPIEPYQTYRLKVSDHHELYIEESGNPNGIPVLFIHGGPGGGTSAMDRRYFHPDRYRIILFDQRGAGKSTPAACLDENTTWHLVDDIEKIRTHLDIESALVFGGSWGSTLALTYAITHPNRVRALVLRGVFLLRKWEIDWYYQEGASAIFPDVWEKFVNLIPVEERNSFLKAYYHRVTHSDSEIQKQFSRPWTEWEMSTSRLYTSPELVQQTVSDDFALKFARIECHYFFHHGFFETDGWILNQIHRIQHIPTITIQGRYDVVCPPKSAWDLKKAWPEMRLWFASHAGHSAREPEISKALVAATNEFSLDAAVRKG